MSLISGISKQDAVWIKKVDWKGRLLQKRVVRYGKEFDTAFNRKTGRPMYYLFTNLSKNEQTLHILPNKQNFWSRLFGLKADKSLTVNSEVLKSTGKKGKALLVGYRNGSGYNNKKIDELSNKLQNKLFEDKYGYLR